MSASILRARVLSCVAPASCPCPCVLAILRACAGVLACSRCACACAWRASRVRASERVRARAHARGMRARAHARAQCAARARACACARRACACVCMLRRRVRVRVRARHARARVCACARASLIFSGQTPARENSMGLGPRVWHSKGTRRGPAGSSDNIIALAHPQPVPKFRSPLAAPPPAGDGAPGPALDTARRIPKEAQAVPGVHWQPNPNAAEQLASLLNRKHLGPPVAT